MVDTVAPLIPASRYAKRHNHCLTLTPAVLHNGHFGWYESQVFLIMTKLSRLTYRLPLTPAIMASKRDIDSVAHSGQNGLNNYTPNGWLTYRLAGMSVCPAV